jgi:malonyl-CoA/methylmalonyl-CoA synthetase
MSHPASTIAALDAVCARRPEHPFLVWEGQLLSFGAMREMAAGWAAHYRERGVTPGDRVALFLGNCREFVAAYLGAHMAGAIVVLVNAAYRRTELAHLLGDSGAMVVVTDENGAREVGGVRADLPQPISVLAVGEQRRSEPAPAGYRASSSDVALLAYTSGTTGRAKGAMLTHGNLMANSAAVTAAWRWSEHDRLLLTLPLFHIHGLGVGLHGALLTGSTVELRPGFDASVVLATLARGETTMFFGVPTMYVRLIGEVLNAEFSVLSSGFGTPQLKTQNSNLRTGAVRLFVSGSAPLAPQTFAEFEQLFGQRILERYGMSETVMNLTNPYEGERRPGTVGMPFPGQEARIVDVQTRRVLGAGEHGEIQVRGPHVFKGYWGNPQATAEVLDEEGWFSTGDLGWRSADGYYTIAGRARELIISGGYNIYPREVEEVLEAHPNVAEAAVIGLPDAEFGELVLAVIVPIGDFRLTIMDLPEEHAQSQIQNLKSEIVAWCRDRLASYKKPRRLVFVDALPRNALGKVQKHVLREKSQEG